MDEVLLALKEILAELSGVDTVVIGESLTDIPASARVFIIIGEGDPSETYEYSGTMKRHGFMARIGTCSAHPDPFAEKAVMAAIELSDRVRGKIGENRTLGGLVSSARLESIGAAVENAPPGGHSNQRIRVREMRYEFSRFETAD
jgi:hypothetical protein